MTRYHIGKNGKIRKCMAKGKCPLGGDAPHFKSKEEEENNHYLQTLKNSPYWEVYCADEACELPTTLKGSGF